MIATSESISRRFPSRTVSMWLGSCGAAFCVTSSWPRLIGHWSVRWLATLSVAVLQLTLGAQLHFIGWTVHLCRPICCWFFDLLYTFSLFDSNMLIKVHILNIIRLCKCVNWRRSIEAQVGRPWRRCCQQCVQTFVTFLVTSLVTCRWYRWRSWRLSVCITSTVTCWTEATTAAVFPCTAGLPQRRGVSVSEPHRGGNVRCRLPSRRPQDRYVSQVSVKT